MTKIVREKLVLGVARDKSVVIPAHRKAKSGSAFPYVIPQLNQGVDPGITIKDYFLAALLSSGKTVDLALLEVEEIMKRR